MNAKQLKEAFEKHGVRRVKVGGYDVDGILRGKRYLILDRDTKYTDDYRNVLVREGIQPHSTPAAIAEFECVRRTLCAFNKIRVFEPNDLLRTCLASARNLPLHGALPY